VGQPVCLDGDRQSVASVLLGDLADVAVIRNPGELVRQQGADQVALAVHLQVVLAVLHVHHLVNVQRLVPAGADAVLPRVPGGHVEPSAREQLTQGTGVGLIDQGMDGHPNRNPFFKPHVTALEDQPQLLLAVHLPRTEPRHRRRIEVKT